VLLLSIQDDGRGFRAEAIKGVGLLGMQERIENLGGMFNVESSAGAGTLITIRLPLSASAALCPTSESSSLTTTR